MCQTSSTGPTLLGAALDIWGEKEHEHSSKPVVNSSGWSLDSLGNMPQSQSHAGAPLNKLLKISFYLCICVYEYECERVFVGTHACGYP